MKLIFISTTIMFLGSSPAIAEDAMVISATRTPTTATTTTSSLSVIDAKKINKRKQTTLGETLADVPGVETVQTGSLTGVSTAFIRGAKSEHTLVLWDGIDITDPSSPGGGFNFTYTPVGLAERIEVIKGPQSVLYGSSALGGVINIVPKKGGEKVTQFDLQAGSFGTYAGTFKAGGQAGNIYYGLGLNDRQSAGVSAASERDGNTEKDGFHSIAGDAIIGYKDEKNEVAVLSRAVASDYDLDAGGGVGGDDPNFTGRITQNTAAVKAGRWWNDASFSQLAVAQTEVASKYTNEPDPIRADDLRATYEGTRRQVDLQNDVALGEHTLSAGVSGKQEAMTSDSYFDSGFGPSTEVIKDKDQQATGVFVQDQWLPNPLFSVVLGLRQDKFTKWGTQPTYRAGARHTFAEGWAVKANYGIGFHAPSLYQLYSLYGSEDLQPETSTGFDVGLVRRWEKQLVADVTYFQNRFEDLIDFDLAASKYQNTAEASSEGVETNLEWRIAENLEWAANYTYTEARDTKANVDLLRRPRHRANTAVSLDTGPVTTTLLVNAKGKRYDVGGTLPPYGVTAVVVNAKIGEAWEIYARVYNIFATQYEEVKGYTTNGRTGTLGTTLTL